MRSPRLLLAALLIAAATLGGSAAASPAIVSATPNDAEWDIGAYDNCMKIKLHPPVVCCIESGGVWTGDYAGDPNGTCVAPPAQSAGAQPAPPQANLPPDIPTLAPVPANPPNVAPSLTRAPASVG